MSLENKLLQKGKKYLRNAFITGLSLFSLSCGGDGPTKPRIEENTSPRITSSPISEVRERFNYQDQVKASDADGDQLTFIFLEKPDWLSINSRTGEMTGIAPEVQGDSTLSVKARVSDGKASADQNYNLVVKNISNTYVVTNESPERIMVVDEDRITFSGSPQFSQGDIISSGITEETPEGILRKVESISGNVVYTEQATLEEAVKRGNFKFSGKITPDGVNKNAARKGVSFFQTSLFDIGLNLEEVALYEGNLGEVVANGSVGMNLGYDLEADIKDVKIQRLLFTLTATGRYELSLKSSLGLESLDEKLSLEDLIPLKPFVIGYIPVGPIAVPVTVHPKIGLDVGISGNVDEIETGISQEVSFTAGLKYENGSWSPVANLSNNLNFDSPQIKKKNLDFKAFAGPTIKFPIYNVAGPYGFVPGFIGFETTSEGWVASGGLEALLGVHAQIFGRTLADYSARVFERSKIVGEGGFVQDGGSEPLEELTVTLPGGAIIDFVYIEPGTFLMGAPDSDELAAENEKPQHKVTITNGFYLGKYELTQGQWESVTGTSPWRGRTHVVDEPQRPATYISWNDVQGFIHVLNAAERDSLYRLPTEAEWEYACRAGTTTRWSFGDDKEKLKDYAWYFYNTINEGEKYAKPVGTKLPNQWGLYDMYGNVYEWVQDWMILREGYSSDPQIDPRGPEIGDYPVVRGESIWNTAQIVWTTSRGGTKADGKNNWTGTRILRIKKD